MIIRDEYSRHVLIFHKSYAADTFAKIMSDLRIEGTPSEVKVVRSDVGGEFSEGKFGKVCRGRNIKQELTAEDSSDYMVLPNEGWL